jgi:hypothetical protein
VPRRWGAGERRACPPPDAECAIRACWGDSERLRGSVHARDAPTRRAERILDLLALRGIRVGGGRRLGARQPKSPLSSTSPWDRMMARSTMFCSSRTLPGHEAFARNSIALRRDRLDLLPHLP